MDNQNNLKHVRHWQCRLCGHRSHLTAASCENPACRADLSIYGVVVESDRENTDPQCKPSDRQQPAEIWNRTSEAKAEHHQAQMSERSGRREKDQQSAQGRREGRSTRLGGIATAVVLLFVLCCAGGYFLLGGTGFLKENVSRDAANPPDISAVSDAQSPWRHNILMEDLCDVSNTADAYGLSAFGTELTREEIGTVTFLDSLEDRPDNFRDVSQARDGSVAAWWTLDSGTGFYNLFIGAEGGVSAPTVSADLFRGYCNMRSIRFNDAFHTEQVIRMDRMFNDCLMLTELDVSGFDTSQVKDLYCMFYQCKNLRELDISNWDTSQATNMGHMFWMCESLAELDVNGWNTSNVTDMSGMFIGCSALTQLDVSNWDTSQVMDMSYMFYGCSGLTQLDVSKWDTAQVTNLYATFYNCGSLEQLNVNNWDTSQVTDMSYVFYGCSSLTQLDISTWNMSRVTGQDGMFLECPAAQA